MKIIEKIKNHLKSLLPEIEIGGGGGGCGCGGK